MRVERAHQAVGRRAALDGHVHVCRQARTPPHECGLRAEDVPAAPMASNAAARSARSSAGPAGDGTQSLSDALMDEKIVKTVLARGPVRA